MSDDSPPAETEPPDGPPPEAFGPVEESADGEIDTDAEGSRSPLKALLHTEPDENPDNQPGETAAGHAIVGSKKVAHYVSEGGVGSGTPAILNFVMAGYHALQGREDHSDEPLSDGEEIDWGDE